MRWTKEIGQYTEAILSFAVSVLTKLLSCDQSVQHRQLFVNKFKLINIIKTNVTRHNSTDTKSEKKIKIIKYNN